MEIKSIPELPALTVRMTTSIQNLPQTIGQAYGAIMEYLGRSGKAPTGNPFIIYYNMDMENLDVEAGFPVEPGTKGTEKIHVSKVPGGKAATAVHTGSYETLAETYAALTAFVKENKVEAEPWMWEMYLNSPQDTPKEKLMTQIFFPLKN